MSKEIQLRGKLGGKVIVDDLNYDELSKYKWSGSKGLNKIYAFAYIPSLKKHIYMHRLLMEPNAKQQIDHINGDTLDNRLSNLRLCTPAQNCANRESPKNKYGYRGISKRNSGKWSARICVRINGKRRVISKSGFINIEDAARAYNKISSDYFGEFARLNEVN